jgi:hypothetical protein
MSSRAEVFLDLDATATLAAAEAEVTARRQQGVERLLLLLHWADLYTDDPQARPGAVPISRGGDRLVRLGGEGTPEASDLCWAELAVALQVGAIALRNQAGQALDLRHRLPRLWEAAQALLVEPWVAQKIATMTRPLTAEQARLVDAAVVEAIEESPGRMLAIAEAKTIEADLDGHRARLAEDEQRAGVWLSRPRPGDLVDADQGEPGSRRISAKLPAADAVEGAAMVDDLAEALAVHGDHAAGTDRRPQRRSVDPLPPSRQDPRRLPGRPARPGRLPLGHPARPRPHRHSQGHPQGRPHPRTRQPVIGEIYPGYALDYRPRT